MSQVSWVLSADESKAVAAFMKVVESQKKAEAGMQRMAVVSKGGAADAERYLSQIEGMTSALGAGVAGALSVAGVSSAFNAVTGRIQESRKEVDGFEGDMTGLLSLGGNLDNVGAVKDQVLDMSAAWGISRKEIANTMFGLQSGTANLDVGTREALMQQGLRLTQLAGGNLENNLKAIIKTYQIYRGELGTADVAGAKVFKTMELGYVTMEELSTAIADVAAPAQAMGIGFNDLAGAIITGTQYGGKTEKTMTGIRNAILELSKAESLGITLTGSLADRFQQLSKLSGDELRQIFGNESLATASMLVKHFAEMRDNAEAVANVSKTILQEKISKRLQDPSAMNAELGRSAEAMIANAPLRDGFAGQFAAKNTEVDSLRLGATNASPLAKMLFLDKAALKMSEVETYLKADTAVSTPGTTAMMQSGARMRVEALRKAGKTDEAEYLEIAQLHRGAPGDLGRVQFPAGTPLAGRALETNQGDADRFLKLKAEMPGMTKLDFFDLRRKEKLAEYDDGRAQYGEAAKSPGARAEAYEIIQGLLRDSAVAHQKAAEAQQKAAESQQKSADQQSRTAAAGRGAAFNQDAHN
jgi:hypothetical protein